MSHMFAFLRAINVGGHNIKMENLRKIFEELGLTGVETFIASGNVVFETTSRNQDELVSMIENKLQTSLGYPVATFIRSELELAEIVSFKPFDQAILDPTATLNIAFLSKPLDHVEQQKLYALRTEIDDFDVHGRQVYWLCLKKQSESTFSNAILEKTIRRPSTLRGIKTLIKIME